MSLKIIFSVFKSELNQANITAISHITKEDIMKISRLAKIAVAENEYEELSNQLTRITSWVGTLNEVDTSNVEPMVSVFKESLRLEKDEVSDGEIADDVLKNSKDAKYGYFTVPKMIE